MGRVSKAGVTVRSNSIRLSFTHEGVRHQPTLMLNGEPMKPTAPNVRYAHRLAAEVTQKIAHATFSMSETFPASDSGATLTVASHLQSWLDAQRLEQSTLKGYIAARNFWVNAFGFRPLRSLKHSDILKATAARPDLSGKTINNYTSVLREALQMGVLDGTLTTNAMDNVPQAKWQKSPADPFTREEADRIIERMRTHQPEAIYNMVEWWFFSGVRTSEMAGLRWPQVDLASGQMVIKEAIVRGIEKDSTKTDTIRTVRLNSRALAAIKRQKAQTLLGGDHVWLDPRYGQPWNDERAFRRSYWTPTLKALEIRYRRPYNMRHTYATMMLMAGMRSPFCAKQLGHSVDIFHTTYAKWIDGEQDDAEMGKLEDSIRPIAPELLLKS